MFSKLNRLGDRLLSALVPNATAAAGCQYFGNDGCDLYCCTAGARTRLQRCCYARPCVTIGDC